MPLGLRLSNAAVSYIRYLGKAVWPLDLAVFYPFSETIPVWQTVLAVLVLAGITAIVCYPADRSLTVAAPIGAATVREWAWPCGPPKRMKSRFWLAVGVNDR